MYISINSVLKQCNIWVDYTEKSSYKSSDEYVNTIAKYKTLKYKVSVFVGGNKPLLPTIISLLEAQSNN